MKARRTPTDPIEGRIPSTAAPPTDVRVAVARKSRDIKPWFIPQADWARIVASLEVSKREAAICACLLNNITQEAQIALELRISPHTVHTYFERLRSKLDVHNKYEVIVRLFQEFGLRSTG